MEIVVDEWAEKNIKARIIYEDSYIIIYRRSDKENCYGMIDKKGDTTLVTAVIGINNESKI